MCVCARACVCLCVYSCVFACRNIFMGACVHARVRASVRACVLCMTYFWRVTFALLVNSLFVVGGMIVVCGWWDDRGLWLVG